MSHREPDLDEFVLSALQCYTTIEITRMLEHLAFWKVSLATHQAAEEPHVEDLEKNVFDGPALRVGYRIVEGLVPESSSKVPLNLEFNQNPKISDFGRKFWFR